MPKAKDKDKDKDKKPDKRGMAARAYDASRSERQRKLAEALRAAGAD